ncbi:cyclin-dependent kinase inhibitor 3-like [Apium graveolens]|uniref:cyclin-dependent kinase inhibitor 3-like n=1 Tax=Apium graveolens TaxID=4045 RepID=UPI003D7AA4B3
MGRYMRKAKITNDTIALVTDLSSSNNNTTICTRAKTLALQQQKGQANCVNSSDPSSYLQLRSRRLERSNLFGGLKLRKSGGEEGQKIECGKARMRNVKLGLISCGSDEKGCFGDVGEGSFGENDWEFQARDGSTRETTPCNPIRSSDSIGTPGSSTRRAGLVASNQRSWNMMQQIPTSHEMEDFFTFAQQEQQRLFTEKYNFDVVNDVPLPGRYEWVSVHP